MMTLCSRRRRLDINKDEVSSRTRARVSDLHVTKSMQIGEVHWKLGSQGDPTGHTRLRRKLEVKHAA